MYLFFWKVPLRTKDIHAAPALSLSLSPYEQVLQAYLMKRNITVHGSLAWLSHQVCDDMFMSSKWNGSTTYGFGNNERDFGTDYGICCW